MRLPKIRGKKAQPTADELKRTHDAVNHKLISNLSSEDADTRIRSYEARLNLAIGLSPILAQLRYEWGNKYNKQ